MYELLQKLCNEQGLTVTNLCIQVTGSKGNLATWKKDYMRSDYLAKCADILDCSVDYILGRTDVPEVNHGVIAPPCKVMIYTEEQMELKLVGKAAAGSPLEMIANDCDLLHINSVSESNVHLYPTDIVVEIQGDSMVEAGIYNGDFAVIRPCPVAENGQIALVAVGDGCTLKRFYLNESGVELHPCNDAYPIQKYKRPTDIRIIGTFLCTCDGDIIERC